MKHILILPSSYTSAYNLISAPFFRDQALALKKQGNRVGVLCPLPISIKKVFHNNKFSFEKEKYIDDGIPTRVFPFPSIPKSFTLNSKIRLAIGKYLFKRYIKEFGMPDIIHVHNFYSGNIAIWAKEQYNIPFVVTEHSSAFINNQLSRSQLKFAKEVYQRSDMNIAVSIGFSEILIKKMGIQFITIPNVVDVDFFSLVNDKLDKSNFKFLNIGHLNSNKNQIHLIESFLNKFKGDSSKKLTVAGYGPLRKKIDSFVNKNDSHNQINLLNAPSRSEVKDLIHQSDCLVVSSIIETFSVVVIESLSCGIPVVSVSSPGPCSILINENYGLLCGANELGDSLNNIVERKDFYEKEKIRSYVVNTFSEKVISTKLQKVYASVCN
jgi:glycosyltransferase involved in cell wall biosynthesis